MAAKLGKCINYASCGIAYRNELVPAQTTAFICPECGKPLKDRSASMKLPPWLLAVAALVGVLALAGIGWWMMGKRPAPPTAKKMAVSPAPRMMASPSAAPAMTASTRMSSPVPAAPATMAESTPGAAVFDPSAEPIVQAVPDSRPGSVAAAKPTPKAASPAPQSFAERIKSAALAVAPTKSPMVAIPPVPVEAAAGFPADNANPAAVAQESAQVRQEVLKRIDAMPKLSKENKSKLYSNVEKAKSMNKLLTVPFDIGRANLNPNDEADLKRRVQSPAFQRTANDSSTVFVILGYADTQGDPQRNMQLSVSRAQTALEALRGKESFLNEMHAVGMGGSNLLDASKHSKNRVAEIWAVIP